MNNLKFIDTWSIRIIFLILILLLIGAVYHDYFKDKSNNKPSALQLSEGLKSVYEVDSYPINKEKT